MEIRNNKGFVKWLLIGVSVIFLLIMLVLPLVYVIYTALREGSVSYTHLFLYKKVLKIVWEDFALFS